MNHNCRLPFETSQIIHVTGAVRTIKRAVRIVSTVNLTRQFFGKVGKLKGPRDPVPIKEAEIVVTCRKCGKYVPRAEIVFNCLFCNSQPHCSDCPKCRGERLFH